MSNTHKREMVMNQKTIWWSLFLMTLGVMLGSSTVAMACKCKTKTDAQATARADLVVYGTVSMYEETKPNQWQAHVTVKTVYKGQAKVGEAVVVHNSPSNCAARFVAGRPFMVFAKKKDNRYITSRCMRTRSLNKAPIAPGVHSILAYPVGAGDVMTRVARASDVMVVQVKKTGSAFAGSWHRVAVEGKIKQSFRGKKKGKITFQIDQKACQKQRSILSDDEVDGELGKKLVKVGKSYLVFTFGESPAQVEPCHGNLVAIEDAKDVITTLKAKCKKGACQSLGAAFVKVKTMRQTLQNEVRQKARATIELCHKKHVKSGVVTDIDFQVAIQPKKGNAVVRKVNTSGTVEQSSVYDAMVKCMIDTTQNKWQMTPYEGYAIRAKMKFKLSPKHTRRLKYASEQVTLVRDRK